MKYICETCVRQETCLGCPYVAWFCGRDAYDPLVYINDREFKFDWLDVSCKKYEERKDA